MDMHCFTSLQLAAFLVATIFLGAAAFLLWLLVLQDKRERGGWGPCLRSWPGCITMVAGGLWEELANTAVRLCCCGPPTPTEWPLEEVRPAAALDLCPACGQEKSVCKGDHRRRVRFAAASCQPAGLESISEASEDESVAWESTSVTSIPPLSGYTVVVVSEGKEMPVA